MKNRAVLKFFLIYFGFTITSNFVHPITPAFLQMIEAPSYIQGVAFSVMSFFTFLTAPFWGKMGDRKPYPKMIAFGYFGYALGQTVFAAARSVPMLLAARTISGLLNGALQVNALAYLISVSDSESRGKYMAYYAMLQSVGTCIGYFVGGSIGDYSLMLVFYIQIASVLFLGVISPIVLRDAPGRQLETGRINYQEINPVASMFTSMKKVDAAMGVYLATVFCFGFAMMAYDNYFSYFLRDQLGFPTSVNGYFKALIGVIAIIANSTINMWINKHTGEVTTEYISEKETMVVRLNERGGTKEVPVPEDQREAPVLTDDERNQLVTLDNRIEAFYKKPEDIEWAIVDGQVYLLQSRPITTMK